MVANPTAFRKQQSDQHLSDMELRQIIAECQEIPIAVRSASLTFVHIRLLDDITLKSLASQPSPFPDESDWDKRLNSRQTNLAPYANQVLACVFVRLPGVHFTIEIDPTARSIVHWEWQEI